MSADDGLRALFRRHLTPLGFTLTAVETGGTTSGVPDTYWVHLREQKRGWLEHKATSGWSVTVRDHQLGFLRRETVSAGRGAVAVRARGAGSAAGHGDSMWLVAGAGATLLSEVGLRGLPPELLLGRWYGKPAQWDWAGVARLLLD